MEEQKKKIRRINSQLKPETFSSSSQFIVSIGTSGDNLRLSYNGVENKAGFNAWFSAGTGITRSNNVISTQEWSFLVGVRKGTIWRIYINGELDSELSGKSTIKENQNLSIGKHPGSWMQDFFKGSVDDIRIYNIALSEKEIQDLYHEGGW